MWENERAAPRATICCSSFFVLPPESASCVQWAVSESPAIQSTAAAESRFDVEKAWRNARASVSTSSGVSSASESASIVLRVDTAFARVESRPPPPAPRAPPRPPSPPHPFVPLEAHPVPHDDVRLARVGVRAVVDRGASGGVHLERIADAFQGPVVREVRTAQHRSRDTIHRDHVLVRLEPLLVQEIRRIRGVQGEGRVADVHEVPLPDHVEAPDAGEPGHAVSGQGAPRLLAVRQYAAAREHVGLALSHHHLLGPPPDRVDLHDAGAPPGGVRRLGRGPLDQREQHERDDHWFGSVNLPPCPLMWVAVTTLKSGSEVKPSPMMWRGGSSNTNGLSELTWFFTWL